MIVWRRNSPLLIRCALLMVLSVVLLTGCRPRGVMSSRKMKNVLVDLHYADAVLQTRGYNYGHDELIAQSYQRVLDKYGLTQADFDSSMVWYTDHPQFFDKIYPRVIEELEQRQLEWEKMHESLSEVEQAVEYRALPDWEEKMREYREGIPCIWPDEQKNAEKMKKEAEKFAYVKINA